MPVFEGGSYPNQVESGSSVALGGQSGHLYREVGLRNRVRVVGSRFTRRTLAVGNASIRRSLSTRDDIPPGPAPPSSLSGGAIGGIVICVILSILLILLGVFIWNRRDKKQGDSSKVVCGERDLEERICKETFGTGPVIHHTPSLPALPPLRIPSPSDSAMVSVSPIESDSDESGGVPRVFTFTNVGSRTGSICIEPDSMVVEPSEFEGQDYDDQVKVEQSEKVSPLLYPPVAFGGDPSGWNSRQSRRPLPQPRITINDNLQYRSSAPDLRTVRMQVEGRLQDFGPAAGSFFAVPDPNSPVSEDDDLLPPDYIQATQPFPGSMSVPVSPSSPLPSMSLR